MRKKSLFLFCTGFAVGVICSFAVYLLYEKKAFSSTVQGNSSESFAQVGFLMSETAELAEFLEVSSIENITLKRGISAPEGVQFCDEDLVSEWISYLNNIRIERVGNSTDYFDEYENTDGGTEPVVTIIETKSTAMYIYKKKSAAPLIEVEGIYYLVLESDFPFDETYDAGNLRQETATFWD